jgi:hypothetical protein
MRTRVSARALRLPSGPSFDLLTLLFWGVARGGVQVFEYEGIYHAMNQGQDHPQHVNESGKNSTGVVNITHAVSNDLVHWHRVQDAIPRGIQGACDGTVSFPGGSFGTSPVLMFGPDCADPDGFPPGDEELASGAAARTRDFPRVATALPSDPSDPHLLQWSKGPRNVSFVNGSAPSEPCSFPGKVWKSTVGSYWNMLCSPHWTGNWGATWARYDVHQACTIADFHFVHSLSMQSEFQTSPGTLRLTRSCRAGRWLIQHLSPTQMFGRGAPIHWRISTQHPGQCSTRSQTLRPADRRT